MTKDEIFESKVRPVADTMLKQAAKIPKPGMQDAFYKELQAVNWSLNEYDEVEIQDFEGFRIDVYLLMTGPHRIGAPAAVLRFILPVVLQEQRFVFSAGKIIQNAIS